MFVKKFLHISCAHISKRKGGFNTKSSAYYFPVKTKMLADFQICISVPLTDQISLPDCLYLLRYFSICAVPLIISPDCAVINFEINLIFLIKPFSYMTEKSRQKFKYLEDEKRF